MLRWLLSCLDERFDCYDDDDDDDGRHLFHRPVGGCLVPARSLETTHVLSGWHAEATQPHAAGCTADLTWGG